VAFVGMYATCVVLICLLFKMGSGDGLTVRISSDSSGLRFMLPSHRALTTIREVNWGLETLSENLPAVCEQLHGARTLSVCSEGKV